MVDLGKQQARTAVVLAVDVVFSQFNWESNPQLLAI